MTYSPPLLKASEEALLEEVTISKNPLLHKSNKNTHKKIIKINFFRTREIKNLQQSMLQINLEFIPENE